MSFEPTTTSSISHTRLPFFSVAKSLGRRIGKVTSQSADVSGTLSAYVSEMIKASRMIKIYQQEKFEFNKIKSFKPSVCLSSNSDRCIAYFF